MTDAIEMNKAPIKMLDIVEILEPMTKRK